MGKGLAIFFYDIRDRFDYPIRESPDFFNSAGSDIQDVVNISQFPPVSLRYFLRLLYVQTGISDPVKIGFL